MTLKSYRKERVDQLHRGLEAKKAIAGKLVQATSRSVTPVDTTTLRRSIDYAVDDDGVNIGVGGVKYAGFVHNGTMDFHHEGDWSEAEGAELLAWKSAQTRRGGSRVVVPPKGLMPRPFLVYGLVIAKPGLREIFGAPIEGR